VKTTDSYTDEQLTGHLRKGDMWAFEAVYHRYWTKLYAFAYHQIGVKEDAEQVVHDVFEYLWVRRSAVEIHHLGVYLMVATKHTISKFIRSQITFRKYQEYLIFQQMHLGSSPQSEAEASVQFGELAKAVDEALKQLPDRTAQVFRMSRLERRSHREIADSLGLSEKAIEYHVTKSLKYTVI
jgi:RNA polymerase sigma-70 factor (family 1)